MDLQKWWLQRILEWKVGMNGTCHTMEYIIRESHRNCVLCLMAAHGYMSRSLNELLLQGPDFVNSLCGVLCRLRKEPVAFVCDIEKMFLQFKVDVQHRNYLRFLWWEKGDMDSEPLTYRMTRHLFGTTSSPGCANFALRNAASEGEREFGTDVANFIKRDFYVDDGLKSVSAPDEAIRLIDRSGALCAKYGLN